ncbi:MAG TPA: LysR substrate-binding domain-containing protein, partial [Solirubrobacteraceae bacterium]|nr:LysR substrate-binding domain-containing protein [Solirubrobacteraceae bacterium]
HRTGDWHAVLALVRARLGVALVPRLASIVPPAGVQIRRLDGTPPVRHVIGVCRGGAEHRPAVRATLAAVRAAARPYEDLSAAA